MRVILEISEKTLTKIQELADNSFMSRKKLMEKIITAHSETWHQKVENKSILHDEFSQRAKEIADAAPQEMKDKANALGREIDRKVFENVETNGEIKNTLIDDVLELANRKIDVEKQIEAIRAETLPKHIITPLGKKSWQYDQNKRIETLNKQLR